MVKCAAVVMIAAHNGMQRSIEAMLSIPRCATCQPQAGGVDGGSCTVGQGMVRDTTQIQYGGQSLVTQVVDSFKASLTQKQSFH